MQTEKVPFDQIDALSFKDKFYQQNPDKLKNYISEAPDFEGLKKAIERRRDNFPVNRDLLVSVLNDHYSHITPHVTQEHNINKLKDEGTFTIVTAHQPSLLGGPAYYFYKIFSILNLCRQLKVLVPEYHFVPVFINGSEDHDFDEVKSLHLFGKTVEWDIQEKGPVGKFSLLGLDKIISEVAEILGSNDNSNAVVKIFSDALSQSKDYNDFVFRWLNAFFGKNGLIVLNMDDKRLKNAFIPIFRKEITERNSINLVQKTQDDLSGLGFRPQAFARDINVFYIDKGMRERIYLEDGIYRVNHTDITLTEDEILLLLEEFPEKFSPNVVTRPLYQEFILPNLAYIGGGGEISYWLERKSQFEYFNIHFPILIRRNSIMIITKAIQKSMEKLNVDLKMILNDENSLVNLYLDRAANTDFHLAGEISEISEIFEVISVRAKLIDPTLGPFVLSEGHKVVKSIEAIESRLKKTLKQKEETSLGQLKNLRSKLFPENGLQERKESLLQYFVSEGNDFQEILIDFCDPMQKEFLFVYL